ncbi:hypothetical protein BHE74_00041193, partial [Ensete ventricosum]
MNLKKEGRYVVNRGEDLTVIDFGGNVSLAEKLVWHGAVATKWMVARIAGPHRLGKSYPNPIFYQALMSNPKYSWRAVRFQTKESFKLPGRKENVSYQVGSGILQVCNYCNAENYQSRNS